MLGEAIRRHGSNVDSTPAILRPGRKYESKTFIILNLESSPPREGTSLRPLRIPRGSGWVVGAKATHSSRPDPASSVFGCRRRNTHLSNTYGKTRVVRHGAAVATLPDPTRLYTTGRAPRTSRARIDRARGSPRPSACDPSAAPACPNYSISNNSSKRSSAEPRLCVSCVSYTIGRLL